ncbi:MAG: Lysophospholipase L1-like esterase, partial [Pseudonocardiales bacterium]|nr:Lysophospholipase L1-like esterase [Pseudonocardiales bacterium]
EAGGRTVSLGDILGPRFATEHDLFGADAFHPSARGYAAAIEVSLPSAAAALGLPTHSESAGPFLTTRARPVAQAAARAAAHPGTEVEPTQVAGEDRGHRGRWARLQRRSSQSVSDEAAERADSPLTGSAAGGSGSEAREKSL